MLTEARSVVVTNVTTEEPVCQIEAVSLHKVKQLGSISRHATDVYGLIANTVTTEEPVCQIESVSLHKVKHSYSSVITRVASDKEALAALLNISNVGTEDVLIENMFEVLEWSDEPFDGKTAQVTVEATPAAPFIGDMTFGYNRIKSIDLTEEYGIRSFLECSDYIKNNLVEGYVLVAGMNKLPLKEGMIFDKDSYLYINIIVPTNSVYIDFVDSVITASSMTTSNGFTFTNMGNVAVVDGNLVFQKNGSNISLLFNDQTYIDCKDEIVLDITIDSLPDNDVAHCKIFGNDSTKYGIIYLETASQCIVGRRRHISAGYPADKYTMIIPKVVDVGERLKLYLNLKDGNFNIRTDDVAGKLGSTNIGGGITVLMGLWLYFGSGSGSTKGLGFTLHSITFNGY